MSSFFSADGECLLISPDQWEQLDVALEAADIDHARELWRAWGSPLMPIDRCPDSFAAAPAHRGGHTS
jgi:hypothetical protein